jgi:hypothetical protein
MDKGDKQSPLKYVRVEIINKSSKTLKLASAVPEFSKNTVLGDSWGTIQEEKKEWTLPDKLWRKEPSKVIKPLCSVFFALESRDWSGIYPVSAVNFFLLFCLTWFLDMTGNVQYNSENVGDELRFQFFWNVSGDIKATAHLVSSSDLPFSSFPSPSSHPLTCLPSSQLCTDKTKEISKKG